MVPFLIIGKWRFSGGFRKLWCGLGFGGIRFCIAREVDFLMQNSVLICVDRGDC
jgi:hypothetical protein